MEKIYSPEFIPYYIDIVKKYELNDCQALVYGFVRFYTSGGNEFWFQNEQLGVILNRSAASINLALGVLEKKNLIYREMTILSSNGSKRKVGLVNNILTTTVNKIGTSTVNKIGTSTVNNILLTKKNIKENRNNIEENNATAQSIFDYYSSKFKGNKKTHKRAVAISRILDRLKETSEPLIYKAIDSYFETKNVEEPEFIKPCENFFGYERGTKIKFIEGFIDDIKHAEHLKGVCLQDLSESQLSERIGYSLEDIIAFKTEIRDEFEKLSKEDADKFKAIFKKVEAEKLKELGIFK